MHEREGWRVRRKKKKHPPPSIVFAARMGVFASVLTAEREPRGGLSSSWSGGQNPDELVAIVGRRAGLPAGHRQLRANDLHGPALPAGWWG